MTSALSVDWTTLAFELSALPKRAFLDSLEHLSDEAKRAWQRGFNLAHPRKGARFVLEDRPAVIV